MSPKGKQARKSQRKKAQEKANLATQITETTEDKDSDSTHTPQNSNNKKRPREPEKEGKQTSESEIAAEPQNKKGSASNQLQAKCALVNMTSDFGEETPLQTPISDHQENLTPVEGEVQKEMASTGDNTTEEVNNSHITSPPPMGPAQWDQIMARFDSFEKSIQATIKEEIKVNSVGIQKQVKSLTSKVKEVEGHISANKKEIAKITQKVDNIDNIQEIIASEVEKQVSNRVASLERDLEVSQAEIAKLKNSKTKNPAQNPNQSDYVTKQEFMKEQSFARKRNLMLMGVEEPKEEEDDKITVPDLLQKRLNIPRIKIDMAIRMGTSPGKYPRPILISFKHMSQRFQVWYKKGELNKDQEVKLWLQEDLPKSLRNELNILLRVQKKAKTLADKYPDVKIKDLRIRVQGNFYSVKDLELLPDDLKPSKSSTPQNENTVVFFGRSSPLSNHHLCKIDIAGRSFTCVEHFLAWQRANVAKDPTLADEVLNMKDPSEHKKTLNALKGKNPEDWEETVENVLLTALRAKFKQNRKLREFLCDSYPRKIGEASLNVKWGIGMSLTNADVLDTTKWNENGNRLGKALEVIREELLQEQPH